MIGDREMSAVGFRAVASNEAGLRLDRWFRRHFPGLGHAHLEKLLRTGQVRVDGSRITAGHRLAPGQKIRVPPLEAAAFSTPLKPSTAVVTEADRSFIRSRVIHRDDDVLAVDKPAGLAVQGGSRTQRHIDAMLDALRFDAPDRPRLVHRLDRDTSGVLLLARNAETAANLAAAFRARRIRKLYWALVVGRPKNSRGQVALPLARRRGTAGERTVPSIEGGKTALTRYALLAAVGRRAAWLALEPATGRTHQLRAHCAALGTPILGDGKYGGGASVFPGKSTRLHLHARRLALPSLGGRPELVLRAPLPDHMRATWRLFGFDVEYEDDPFSTEYKS